MILLTLPRMKSLKSSILRENLKQTWKIKFVIDGHKAQSIFMYLHCHYLWIPTLQ